MAARAPGATDPFAESFFKRLFIKSPILTGYYWSFKILSREFPAYP
jgi:hypothetical protein